MVATKEEVKKLVEEWFFYFRSAGIPALLLCVVALVVSSVFIVVNSCEKTPALIKAINFMMKNILELLILYRINACFYSTRSHFIELVISPRR